MADFSLVLESFSVPVAQNGDDVANFMQELFVSPFPLGFTTCRETGYYRYWINKVWDASAPGGGAWVLWKSVLQPDVHGAGFPDPYQSGWPAVQGTYRAWYYLVLHGDDVDDPLYPEEGEN